MILEYRYAEGKAERFPALAAELVHLPVDVIVAPPAPARLAAKRGNYHLPIVFTLGADPFAFGVLTAPEPQGGNITGSHGNCSQAHSQAARASKRDHARAYQGGDPLAARHAARRDVWVSGKGRGGDRAISRLKGPGRRGPIGQRFRRSVRPGGERTRRSARHVDEPKLQRSDKAACRPGEKAPIADNEWRLFPTAGGLISYGAETGDIYRRAAAFVDKILKGAKPADLRSSSRPIGTGGEHKVARELDLTLPPSLVQRADDLIR